VILSCPSPAQERAEGKKQDRRIVAADRGPQRCGIELSNGVWNE
jgi:hypothetical protein